MAKKIKRAKINGQEIATWMGLPVGASAMYVKFDEIKNNTGFSRYDMSNDDRIKKALWYMFQLGKKTGQMGMKIKHKL